MLHFSISILPRVSRLPYEAESHQFLPYAIAEATLEEEMLSILNPSPAKRAIKNQY
jgi:hypothetical protein